MQVSKCKMARVNLLTICDFKTTVSGENFGSHRPVLWASSLASASWRIVNFFFSGEKEKINHLSSFGSLGINASPQHDLIMTETPHPLSGRRGGVEFTKIRGIVE
jgi:hypothetical protein